MSNYPNITQAIILWQESLSGILKYASPQIQKEYIFHTTGVAETSYKIAQKCNLNPEKAYALGLLHDYGKIQNEKTSGRAHFIVGYDKMIKEGFSDVARVCISHSFYTKDFDFNDFPSYNIDDLNKVKSVLSKIDYDDYDRLIQLCDMFFEGMNKTSYQKRIEGICQRYKLTKKQTKNLESGAKNNKEYFDNLCGCNIYDLLNIHY